MFLKEKIPAENVLCESRCSMLIAKLITAAGGTD